ncbi:MAG: HNH endonuclease, partial [Isosphaeraceae bacterium]|nr:HNH endonuclease [Isosphaeraceae bacterium]
GEGPARRPRCTLDAMGRVVEEIDEAGNAQRWQYDPEGNVVLYQDRDGAVYRYAYNSWNLLHREVAPTGGVTTYDYSIRMEVTRVTDPNGTVSEYIYDAWDRLIEVRRHGRVKERYAYDLADNLIKTTDGEGRPLLDIEIIPGNLEGVRTLAPRNPGGPGADGETTSGARQYFEYDEAGRITRAATGTREVTFAYDESGRLLKDHRDGLGVDHTYDGSELVSTCYFGRFQVSYAWLDVETLAITDPTGAVHHWRISQSGLIARELSSGTTELARYDADGRCLLKAGAHRLEPSLRWRRLYRYSAEGDLLSIEDLAGEVTLYEYDGAHRLRREMLPGGLQRYYDHDLADNLRRQPGLSDVVLQEGNRLQAANGDVFEYDDRNNLVRRRGPGRDVGYDYDALGMLVSCDIDGERWTARYDPLCRRVSKTWRGQTTTYYWDDFRLAAEERPDGAVRLYIYVDTKALVPFLFVEYPGREADPASGRLYFIFTNQIGAPVRVEDDRGNPVWQARIDPYGQAHIAAESQVAMPLRFPGHYHDPETGLHYNRFRYYDPILGRFLQPDPLGIEGGLNLYAYSPNPLVEVDLDGLAAQHKPRKPRAKGRNKKGRGREGRGRNRPRPQPRSRPRTGAVRIGPEGKRQVRNSRGQWVNIRNGDFAGKTHPVSGVPFDRNGFPKFDSKFDTKIDPSLHQASDDRQFRAATKNLNNAMQNDPSLRNQFTQTQRDQIASGETPDGYTWHHHQNTGKMQLVSQDDHAKTGHTGGREIWGG